MNKKKAIIGTKIVVFILLFCILFSQATYVFRNKDNAYAVAGFYTHKNNSFDVIFMGTSRVLDSVYPLDLWNEYGMASYNLAQHAQTMSMSYYAMQDAINRQHPKVIVLDTYFLISDQKISNLGYTHKTIDNMPWSLPKVAALTDYVKSEGFTNMFQYIINLSVFHSRWKELTADDFEPIEDDTMGAEVRYGHTAFDSYTVVDKSQTAEIPAGSMEYLNKIIKLCKDHNVQLVLMTTPSIPFEEYDVPGTTQFKMFNSLYDLAEKDGFTYINLMHHLDELNFDYKTDMYDEGHVNPLGAAKITKYMGQFVMNNFSIQDRRSDQAYSEWNDWYARFAQYKNNYTLTQTYDFAEYMKILQNDPNYALFVTVQGSLGDSIAPDVQTALKNIGLTYDWSQYHQESYLAVLDGNQAVAEQSGDGLIAYTGKVDGMQVELTSDATGVNNASIILDNTAYHSPYEGLGIAVYDKTTHKVVDKVIFDFAHGKLTLKK